MKTLCSLSILLPAALLANGFPELTALGRDAFARGDYRTAAVHWQQARSVAEGQSAEHAAVAAANIASLEYALGHAATAAASYREALRYWEGQDEGRVELRMTLRSLAEVSRSLGEYAETDRLLKRLVSLLERDKPVDAAELARTRLGLARLEMALGHPTQAEGLYRQVLAEPASDVSARASALDGLGGVCLTRGQLPQAEQAFTEAMGAWEAAGQRVRAASTSNRLGDVWLARRQPRQALPYLRRALAVFEEKGIAGAELASVLNNLGQAQRFGGDPKGAAVSFERAYATATSDLGAAHPIAAATLLNLGDLALNRKKYDEAESHLRRALAIDESRFGHDHPAVARDLVRLAKLHLRVKHYGPACDELGQALGIRERLQMPHDAEQAEWFELRAHLLRRSEQYAEAAQLEAKAMRIRVKQSLQ